MLNKILIFHLVRSAIDQRRIQPFDGEVGARNAVRDVLAGGVGLPDHLDIWFSRR